MRLDQLMSGDRLSYSFDFVEPSIQSMDAAYTTISQSGCLAVGKQAGDPGLPVKVVSLFLPPNKTVSRINVLGTPIPIDLSGLKLAEKPLFLQQRSVPFGSDEPYEFVINSDLYSTDAFYPVALYAEYSAGYSHGYPILSFSLNPVQYNPVEGTVQYYPRMTVTITLKDDSSSHRYNPEDQSYVSRFVSNPDMMNRYQLLGDCRHSSTLGCYVTRRGITAM